MPKCAVHKRQHAVGEVVFLEELLAINVALEKRIQIQYRGAPVSGKGRNAWFAKGLQAHVGSMLGSGKYSIALSYLLIKLNPHNKHSK